MDAGRGSVSLWDPRLAKKLRLCRAGAATTGIRAGLRLARVPPNVSRPAAALGRSRGRRPAPQRGELRLELPRRYHTDTSLSHTFEHSRPPTPRFAQWCGGGEGGAVSRGLCHLAPGSRDRRRRRSARAQFGDGMVANTHVGRTRGAVRVNRQTDWRWRVRTAGS